MAPYVSWSSGLAVTSLLVGLSQGASIPKRADVPAPYVAAPYYPAPHTGWIPSWSDSVKKAKALVDTMTLAEKANITAGTGIFMGESYS
jgi:beta-glucosidase